MTILNQLAIALAGSTIAMLGMIANPASAVTLSLGGTVSLGAGQVSSELGATTIDFESGLPTAGAAIYSPATAAIVQGSLGGQYAQPAGDNTKYLTVSPLGSGVPGATGPVTIDFQQALDYFGLYWGSVDTYNSIAFYNDSTLLNTFSGSDVSPTASGDHVSASDNVFANFFAAPGEKFNKVVLASSNIAFESDNHAYRVARHVPEPTAATSFLALGLVGVGSLVKRKLTKVS